MAAKPIDVKGGGWTLGLNSGGYLTSKYHFWAKGEFKPVCYAEHRKSGRVLKPINQTPPEQRCSMCTKWLATHGDGSRRNGK